MERTVGANAHDLGKGVVRGQLTEGVAGGLAVAGLGERVVAGVVESHAQW